MKVVRHVALGALMVGGLVVLAAALAPVVHAGLTGVGLAAEGSTGFLKVFRRLLLIALLPLVLLGLRPWRDGDLASYGLRGPRARLRPFLLGGFATLAVGLALLTWHMAAGWIHWEDPLHAGRAAQRIAKTFVFPAFGVALTEELFFRGWLERRAERGMRPLVAACVVSAGYALLHAFRPSQLDRTVEVSFAGALDALCGWAGTVVDPTRFGPAFVGLTLFGLLLSAVYRRSGTLWASIGVHMAGVWLIYSYGALTDRPHQVNWAGTKLLYDGWPVWVIFAVLIMVLWPRGGARSLPAPDADLR